DPQDRLRVFPQRVVNPAKRGNVETRRCFSHGSTPCMIRFLSAFAFIGSPMGASPRLFKRRRFAAGLAGPATRAKRLVGQAGRQWAANRLIEGCPPVVYRRANNGIHGGFRMIAALRGPSFVMAAVALAWSNLAVAQDFPTKPIKIIVPFGAGG